MAKPSLPTTIAITALSTALAVGAYMHFSIVDGLQAQIDELKTAAAGIDMDFVQEFVGSLEPVQSPSSNHGEAPDNWIYGNAKARYTLVEMTDTECPYCKAHFPILKSLVDSSGGNINSALLHVPALGEASRTQALAIECAGEQGGSDAAWKFTQLVFEKTGASGKGVPEPLVTIAAGIGLDKERFSRCMDSTQVIERVMADLEQVQKLGIKQTPSTLVMDNVTGASMILQGANANHEGILSAIASVSKSGGPQ